MTEIRSFKFRNDISAILELEKAAFGEDAFPVFEFVYLYMIGKDTFLIAHQGKKLVGYISAYVEENIAYIASIAVDKQFRRQGIARKLILSIIEILQARQNIPLIQLHVRQSNQAAIALYHSLGFVISFVEIDYYKDEDGLVMTLSLGENSA